MGQRLFLFGGISGDEPLRSAEMLDTRQLRLRWQLLPPMLERRAVAVAASVRGRIVVAGGAGGPGSVAKEPLRSAEAYVPGGALWEAIAEMELRRVEAYG